MIECNRTLEQAKRDYASGRLTSVSLIRVPMSGNEWQIRLAGSRRDSGMLLALPTLTVQSFSSLDAAIRVIEEIGFSFTELKVQ